VVTPELRPLRSRREDNDSRGLETVLVSWSGSNDALALAAAIKIQRPGDVDSRMISRVEGHYGTK
jgi:hypothetical protein